MGPGAQRGKHVCRGSEAGDNSAAGTGRFEVRNCFNSTLVAIMGNIMLPLRFGDGARTYYIAKTEKIPDPAGSHPVVVLDHGIDRPSHPDRGPLAFT